MVVASNLEVDRRVRGIAHLTGPCGCGVESRETRLWHVAPRFWGRRRVIFQVENVVSESAVRPDGHRKTWMSSILLDMSPMVMLGGCIIPACRTVVEQTTR